MLAAAEADQFFLLGIILKNSGPRELVADFLPATSVAKLVFFFLRKIIQ